MYRSFTEYSRIFRIRYSKILLCNSDMEIKEIAYKVGYKTVPHFYRDFVEYEKNTPRNYRKKNNDALKRNFSEKLQTMNKK